MSEELQREHIITYECTTCHKASFTPSEFKEHLRTVHHVTEFTGHAKMTLHLDTATHYFSAYEGDIHGIKYLKSSNTERESAFRIRQRKASKAAFNKLPPLMP